MIQQTIRGFDLSFLTDAKLFSPRQVYEGSLALLETVTIERDDKVLDLGCGYGVLGIVAAKLALPDAVFLLDSDPVAVEYSRQNAALNEVGGISCIRSEGFRDFHETGFSKILCNPPYHVDFSVPKHFIEKGFNRLTVGGVLWMVTKRDRWYRNKLTSIFGGVSVHLVGTYFVFEARKTSTNYAHR